MVEREGGAVEDLGLFVPTRRESAQRVRTRRRLAARGLREVKRGQAARNPRTRRLSGPYGRQQTGNSRCCLGRRRPPRRLRRPRPGRRLALGQRPARRTAQKWPRHQRTCRALRRPARGRPGSALPARRSLHGPRLPGAWPNRQALPGLKPGLL